MGFKSAAGVDMPSPNEAVKGRAKGRDVEITAAAMALSVRPAMCMRYICFRP
jgi:hypothetical protein